MQITYISNDLRKLLVELCELRVEEILELESRLTQALLSLASEWNQVLRALDLAKIRSLANLRKNKSVGTRLFWPHKLQI